MDKYTTYEFIDKKDISLFSGLEKETLTYISPSKQNVPLTIECFGITFPDKQYRIKRANCNYFILEYIVSGKGTLIKDEKKYPLEANTVYLLEPGSMHEYYANKDDPFKKYWINFRSDVFFNIFKAYGLNDTTVFPNVDLTEAFQKIFALEKISLSNDEIYMQASSILFDIFMILAKNKTSDNSISDLAQQIKFKLDQSISSKISLDDICKALYISRAKLFREFKKYYHLSPYDYLMQRKINYAKVLLGNTTHSIKDITEILSFSNEQYFCNFFKDKTGSTPSEYRKYNK
jgi:AraC-like DNA-binding protein